MSNRNPATFMLMMRWGEVMCDGEPSRRRVDLSPEARVYVHIAVALVAATYKGWRWKSGPTLMLLMYPEFFICCRCKEHLQWKQSTYVKTWSQHPSVPVLGVVFFFLSGMWISVPAGQHTSTLQEKKNQCVRKKKIHLRWFESINV